VNKYGWVMLLIGAIFFAAVMIDRLLYVHYSGCSIFCGCGAALRFFILPICS